MNGFLKALAYVAPDAAMKRARAVSALGLQKRYAGATLGRRGGSWALANGSANEAIAGKISRLRARSHEMVRDHWAFSRILDVTVGQSIGYGIEIVPDNGVDAVDREVKERFDEWSETADITGELDLHGLTALAVRGMLEGGGSLIRFVPRRREDAQSVPLKLCGLEAEHLDHTRDSENLDGRRVRLGVALGDWDERLGYYLHRRHPNDNGIHALESVYIGADDVVHLYRSLRFGQVIGVPIFAPVLMAARDLADLMEATIVRAKVEACFAGFIKQDGEGDILGEITGGSGRADDVTGIEPGMLTRLSPGEDIVFSQPSRSDAFEPVAQSTLYAMAAGAGITYDQLTGDLRQANYSSLRAGKIEFRRLIEQMQWLTIVPKLHKPIARRWADAAITAGILPDRPEKYRWKYIPPANEPIDPKKDLEADIAAVRAGRMSPQEFIGSYGRDWREVMDDFNGFLTEIDRRGLMFDIDPRRVDRGGREQPSESTSGSEDSEDAE